VLAIAAGRARPGVDRVRAFFERTRALLAPLDGPPASLASPSPIFDPLPSLAPPPAVDPPAPVFLDPPEPPPQP
jgi:hypothetical protein